MPKRHQRDQRDRDRPTQPAPSQPAPASLKAVIDSARDDDVVTLAPGVYREPLTIRRSIILRGEGVTLEGSASVGIRIPDGSGHVTLEGLTVRGWGTYGIFATHAAGLTVRRVRAIGNGTTNILTGGMGNVLIEDTECADPLREHNIYCSEGGRVYVVRRCLLRNAARCNVQVNADPSRAYDVLIEDNRMEGCGNAHIQFAAVTGAVVRGNQFSGGRYDITAWDDAGGDRLACHDIDLSQQPGRVNASANCTGIIPYAG